MIIIIALWALVLFETGLLLLLLRALGELKQHGILSPAKSLEPADIWGLPVGEHAPLFTVTDQNGKSVRLEDFQGRRRILAFVLPGCSSCDDTIHILHAFSLTDSSILVLVIGGSDRDLNNAYAGEEAQLPVLTPVPGFSGELYRLRSVPFVFILDEAGIIRAKGVVQEIEQLQRLLMAAFPSVPVSY
ncbi:MAG: peroxiredoxin family protein [Ktedonobacteraceae bacterium]